MTQVEDIYNLYFKDIFMYVYSLSRDQHIAEDITAETFMKAMKSLHSFKGESDIRVWLCQIAKNSYYSYLRKNNRLVDMEVIPEHVAKDNIVEKITTSESSLEIHKILHRLKEPYKEVFTLRVFGELSFKQIGEILGKSDNWACVTFHRARIMIKERMEGHQ